MSPGSSLCKDSPLAAASSAQRLSFQWEWGMFRLRASSSSRCALIQMMSWICLTCGLMRVQRSVCSGDLETGLEFFDRVVNVAAVCEDSLESLAGEGMGECRDFASLCRLELATNRSVVVLVGVSDVAPARPRPCGRFAASSLEGVLFLHLDAEWYGAAFSWDAASIPETVGVVCG